MSDTLPYVGFGYDDDDKLCATVGPDEYHSLADLFAAAPFVQDPAQIVLLAQALNHFAHEMDYGVIESAEPYRADFLKRYAAEEELPWDQFSLRVGDFDLPDLDQLAPPKIEGGLITFFVNHRGLDAPYKVTGPADGSGKLDYAPL